MKIVRKQITELPGGEQVVVPPPVHVAEQTPPTTREKKREAFKTNAPVSNALEGKAKLTPHIPSGAFSYGWDVLGSLPAAERQRLSEPEKQMIHEVVEALRQSVKAQGLDYVPVFGYLSLRTDNHRELGLKRQADVVPGQHTLEAQLHDHDIGVVASTIYRGTPEHPGVVAGLSPETGASTPGTVLKLPLARAEELLSVIFHREYFAEDDLTGDKPQAMYKPVLRDVDTADGQTVKALVFITNPDSQKDINPKGEMTAGQLAWFMGAQGGFKAEGGRRGGASFDYWNKSYLGTDPVIREAMELAPLVPSPATIDYLVKNAATDLRAMAALNVVLGLFQGAATPVGLKEQQRAEQALERAPSRKPVDVQAEVARYLALEGKA